MTKDALTRAGDVAFVYFDETWATVNMGPDRVWTDLNVLKDPSEAIDPWSGITFGVPGSQGAGKRLIICHAIIELPASSVSQCDDGTPSTSQFASQCRFVPGALLVFRSGGTKADYHQDMNSR